MNIRKSSLAMLAATALVLGGCAVARDQETAGQYVDDSTITTEVKAKFAKSPAVAATSISVETLNGTVQLSGFAKNDSEKTNAEALTREVHGVKQVKNSIIVKP